tara:strand:- start:1195 stop:1536 length:342 start_codon:yes stop_codon:yes gene_type:complete
MNLSTSLFHSFLVFAYNQEQVLGVDLYFDYKKAVALSRQINLLNQHHDHFFYFLNKGIPDRRIKRICCIMMPKSYKYFTHFFLKKEINSFILINFTPKINPKPIPYQAAPASP